MSAKNTLDLITKKTPEKATVLQDTTVLANPVLRMDELPDELKNLFDDNVYLENLETPKK